MSENNSRDNQQNMDLWTLDNGNRVTQSTTDRKTASSEYINSKFQNLQLYTNPEDERHRGGVLQGLGTAGVVAGGLGAGLLAAGTVSFAPIAMVIGGIAGIGFLIYGGIVKGRAKRFREYLGILGQKTLVTFQELREKTGHSVGYLQKDIQKMIDNRLFHYGHVDGDKQYLITADETYKNYLEYLKQDMDRKKEAAQLERELQEKGMTPEGIRIVREGNAYIEKIHRINEKLPEKKITDKLNRLEGVVTALIEEVKKQPGKVDQLRKLMNYYLPTTEKLMNAYIDMEREENKDQELYKSQKEISDTLDNVNDSFEKLLAKLETSRSWDVSADISVMNTMLNMEGFIGNDFKNKGSKEEK